MNQRRDRRNERTPRADQGKGRTRPGSRNSSGSTSPRSGSRKGSARGSAPGSGKRPGPGAGPTRRPERKGETASTDDRRRAPAAGPAGRTERPARAQGPSSPGKRGGPAPAARQGGPHRNVRRQPDTRHERLFPRRPPHDFEPDYEPEVDEQAIDMMEGDAGDTPLVLSTSTEPVEEGLDVRESAVDEDEGEISEDEEDYDEDLDDEFEEDEEEYDEDADEYDEDADEEDLEETEMDLEPVETQDSDTEDAANRIQGVPVVAIVGRPNVGKSALFNRLIGDNVSIVEDQPGVTRDRIYGECSWNRRTFMLVDTGGMVINDEDENLKQSILSHARQAVEEANLVLFVVDATAGTHGLEYDIAELLRRSGRPVLLVANKVDNTNREVAIHEFYEFALGEPWPVSAVHGLGTGDLLDEVARLLPPSDDARPEEDIRLTIVGRPNVGKSSLLNALLNEERVIVDSTPGTTRDAIDTILHHEGSTYRIVDTAGMRRPSRVDDRVEYYSNVRSLRAVRTCDIALLVVDATEGIHQQDQRVAGHIQEARRGVIVVVNKWDLIRARGPKIEEEVRHNLAQQLAGEFNFMAFAPVVFISAREKQGLEDLFEVINEVMQEFTRRIETSPLNRVIQEAITMRPPPTFKGQQLRVFYAFQKAARPPRFVLQVNSTKLLHFSYRRYLENHLRKAFGLVGTPIEIILKK